MNLRIGQGFDAHPLVAGRPCVLGGVRVESDSGPDGHSDGDVVLHALADALLGASAAGDLGTLFGTSDPKWKGAASSLLVQEVRSRTNRPRILNVDITIIALRPRIAEYQEAIRTQVAELLGIDVGQVSVKASSGNGLTDFGRGEGIAASAILLQEGP